MQENGDSRHKENVNNNIGEFKHKQESSSTPAEHSSGLFNREQENLFAGLWMPGVQGLHSPGALRGRGGHTRGGGRRSSLKDIPLPPLPPGVQLPPMEPSAIKALAQKGRLDAIFDPSARQELIGREIYSFKGNKN